MAPAALPLAGRRIALGISGSIGAVQAPALASRLRAWGATVQPFVSSSALQLVGLDALRDASGEEPVVALTGAGEHVRELGPGGADLLLLAPCTANTLAKVALGIDDTPVTTLASVLLGRVPVVVAPAMHDTMWSNPAVRANVERLRGMGCEIVQPLQEEGAAKMAVLDAIEAHVFRALGPRTLQGRRVLVVTGPTAEPLRDGLWLSNRSSGSTGLAIAREAFRCGADVTLWIGWTADAGPSWIPRRRFGSVQELLDLAAETASFEAVVVPAAIGDYAASGSPTPGDAIALKPTAKFLDAVREHFGGALVAFKAESEVEDKELLARARALQQRVRASLVVANRLERVGPTETEALLVEERDARPFRGSKDQLAGAIVDHLASHLDPSR
jgi:phosphopantothenoylcysteine decarboxylase/phosphopantothenate--cysteine ligase